MHQPNRREFLASLGALGLAPFERTEAELILHNGNLITVDDSQPKAQAVAIVRDRLFAVGSDDEVLNLATARTRRVDLEGKTVVPGFVDAHTHLGYSGLRHLTRVDCDLRTIEAIKGAIRAYAQETPVGEWVAGFKYDDTKTAEGRALTRADLDDVAPEHPVVIEHRGGHTSYVNSLALKKLGYDESSNDPPGGHLGRDADGRLNGKLEENASFAAIRALPSDFTREQAREGVKLISHMMAAAGVTSAHDALGTPDDLRSYQDAREAGELALRVYTLIDYEYLDRMLEAGIRSGLGDEWVKVGAVKQICDGSISERTARLSEPFIGRPDDYGIIVTKEEDLLEQSRKAHDAGWQLAIHANGDVGIDITLRVYETLQKENPRPDPRFRLEHCTVINDDLVRRIRALGAIPNPFSTYVYYHGEKMVHYGPERLERMFAVRSFLDAGIRVTQTSDYPPGPFEPMMALQSSVTRTDARGNVWGPQQKISVMEAIRVGTLHGAYASYEENDKGSIEAGKLADLVVLGQDPTRVEPSTLIDVPVERTMIGGRWVHEA
ncbi:MAG TPA: amidohydrolase [Vicinamibacteria bacterium]|nr:amidohydrolase [Vicinamibacteria bacterium]